MARNSARVGIGKDGTHTRAGERGRAGGARQEDEFLPAVALDIIGLHNIDAGRFCRRHEGGEASIGAAVDGAADYVMERARLLDNARTVDHAEDVSDAGDGALGTRYRGDAFVAVDAVLQADDAGVRAEQRARGLGGLFGVPQLDREQHGVDRADALGVVGDVRLRQVQTAVRALDAKAVLAHGRQMGAARDEEHVEPGRRHARAEITADRARRHYRYSHRLAPSECEQGIAVE